MKKLLAFVLTFVMTLSLCSCNNTDLGEIVNKELSRGTVEESVYSSEFLGISVNAPEGWVYATDEELKTLVGISYEMLDYNSMIAELQIVYDMMVGDPYTGSNIIVNFENLTISGAEDITVEDYVGIAKEQLVNIEVFTYTVEEESKITFGGKEYSKLVASCDNNGIVMKQVYYVTKVDKYMACIIVTISDETPIETFEGYISDLN